MADFRTIVIDAGQKKRVQDGDRVIVANGIVSSNGESLELDAAGALVSVLTGNDLQVADHIQFTAESTHRIEIPASTTPLTGGGGVTILCGDGTSGSAGTPGVNAAAGGDIGAIAGDGGAGAGTNTGGQTAGDGKAGGVISIQGGTGGTGTSSGSVDNANSGTGGGIDIIGGSSGTGEGGAGSPTAGNGGGVLIVGGTAVAGDGGDIAINGGTSVSGTQGAINIGTASLSALTFGNATDDATVTFAGQGDIIASNGTLDVPATTSFKVGGVALVEAGFTAANMDIIFGDGTVDANALHIHAAATTIAIADDTPDAYVIAEAVNEYFVINTDDADESIVFGNTTTNPDVEFLGSGIISSEGSVSFVADSNYTISVEATTSISTDGGGLSFDAAGAGRGDANITGTETIGGDGGTFTLNSGDGGVGDGTDVGGETAGDAGDGGTVSITAGTGGSGTLDVAGTTFPTVADEIGLHDGTMTNMTTGDITGDAIRTGFTRYSAIVVPSRYWDIGDVHDIDHNEASSISLWFRSADNGGYLVSKKGAGAAFQGWGVFLTANGAIQFRVTNNAGGSLELDAETTAQGFDDNAWHHVLVTKSTLSTVAGVTIYVDGVNEALTTNLDALGSNTSVTSASLNINSANDDGVSGLTSYYVDVAIWDDEITSGEAALIYNSGIPDDLRDHASATNLVGYWRCGDGDTLMVPFNLGNKQLQSSDRVDPTTVAATFPNVPDHSSFRNPGTLLNMEGGDVQSDTPGGISLRSWDFGGTDERASIAHHTNLQHEHSAPTTHSFWIKTTATGGYCMGKNRDADSLSDPGVYGGIGTGCFLSGGKPTIYEGNGGFWRKIVQSDVTVNDGNWHHCLVSKTRDTLKWYIDGAAVATTTLFNNVGNNSIIGPYPFTIGGVGPTTEAAVSDWAHLVGKIDECGFWQKALNAAQVTEVYNGGVPNNLRDIRSSEAWLIGYWRGGDAGGNPGLCVGMHQTTKRSQAPEDPNFSTNVINFDGSNDEINFGAVKGYNMATAFSCSAWVRWTPTTGADVTIAGNFQALNGPGWQFRVSNGDGPHIFLEGGGLMIQETLEGQGQGVMAPGVWTHLVFTLDGTGDAAGANIYANGELLAKLAPGADSLTSFSTTGDFKIGRGFSDNEFPGDIDELSMWSKELSQSEVTSIYNSGEPAALNVLGFFGDCESWYRMGESAVLAVDNANAGAGGGLVLTAGDGGVAGSGTGSPTGGVGGNVTVRAGSSTGALDGGSVLIDAGEGGSSGSVGSILIGSVLSTEIELGRIATAGTGMEILVDGVRIAGADDDPAGLVIEDTNGDEYVRVDTSTGTETISLSNATNNADMEFLGTGTADFDTGGGSMFIPDQLRLQIGNVQMDANFTGTNLTNLVDGTNADVLHSHANVGSSTVDVSGLTTTGLADGDFGYVSAASTLAKTDAAADASSQMFGVNTGTVGSMRVAGVASSAKFTTDGGSPGNGSAVYLALGTADGSTGAGKLTATAPSAVGEFVAQVGICLDNTNYAGAKTAAVLMQHNPTIEK